MQTGGPFSDRKQRQTPLSGCEEVFQVKDTQSEMVARSLKEMDLNFSQQLGGVYGSLRKHDERVLVESTGGEKPASPENVQKKKMKPVEGLRFKMRSFIVNGVPTQLTITMPRPLFVLSCNLFEVNFVFICLFHPCPVR